MSILEKLPDDSQREIELLRELVKAKDALIVELQKRPAQPVYVPYLTWPSYPRQVGPWTVTSEGVSANSGSITINADANGKVDGLTWTPRKA